MCCHKHPDNGHGLALKEIEPVKRWTLEELRGEAKEWWVTLDSLPLAEPVPQFLDWLEEGT